jgi:hypothetical protein
MPLMRDAETGILREVSERYLKRWPHDYVPPDHEPNPAPPAKPAKRTRRTPKPASAAPPKPAPAVPDKSEGENQ